MKNRKIIFAIGDLHGGYDLMLKTIDAIHTYAKNLHDVKDYQILCLGDYYDRGPKSAEIIEWLINHPNIICLRGNHEQFLLNCLDENLDPLSDSAKEYDMNFWMTNGGIQTLESYGYDFGPGEWLDVIPYYHRKWIANLPTFYETEHHYFVHAGIHPYRALDDQRDKERLWIRQQFLADENPFPKHIVHGHTPRDHDKWWSERTEIRTNLDSGSVWSGKQLVGVFDIDRPGPPLDILQVSV